MFKRIVKVVSLVLLGFAIVIGGTIGFMALRGDFKKQVVKPKAINFSIETTSLTFDAGMEEDYAGESWIDNRDGQRIYSFTISSKPADVTVDECTIKLSNSSLIKFVKGKSDEEGNITWEDYKSNKFYLNRPIFFKLSDLTEETEEDYYDGILTITVKDKSGLLQDTIDLMVDRRISSISFKDQGIGDRSKTNNTITNGLFGYEQGKYGGEVDQKLESVINQDYPLEVMTAPRKAIKPFANTDAKKYEIYFMDDGQPKLVVNDGEAAKLKFYDDGGNPVEENCKFLRYDTVKNNYVFNAGVAGSYVFRLAAYPTYKIQQAMEGDATLSYMDKLNPAPGQVNKMITKTVVFTVNGTEAENIAFGLDNTTASLGLMKDNSWLVNSTGDLGVYNLGLTLSKTQSGTPILGRYSELQFLNSEHFSDRLRMVFRQAKATEVSAGVYEVEDDGKGNPEYLEGEIAVEFYKDAQGKMKATLSGWGIAGVPASAVFDAEIEYSAGTYYLKLDFTAEEGSKNVSTKITFDMNADSVSSKVLTLKPSTENGQVTKVKVAQGGEQFVFLGLQTGNCFVIDQALNAEKTLFNFKTLQAGLYLTMLGGIEGAKGLCNNHFVTSIVYNDEKTLITIVPTVEGFTSYDLYAVVVNTNGTWTYTTRPLTVIVNTDEPTVETNDIPYDMPITVEREEGTGREILNCGAGLDAKDLVAVQNGASYNQVLLFAREYDLLTAKPAEWGKGLEVFECISGAYTLTQDTEYNTEKQYYVKNHYRTIDLVTITASTDVVYYLVGYIENNKFVNKVVATNPNYYSKVYPVVVKTKYLADERRLQTSEEYINELLAGKTAVDNGIFVGNGGNEAVTISYDLSLLENRHLYKYVDDDCTYVQASGAYNSATQYYRFDETAEEFVAVEVDAAHIANWNEDKVNYYERLGRYINATAQHSESTTYYRYNGQDYAVAEISEEEITDWASNYQKYFVRTSLDFIPAELALGEVADLNDKAKINYSLTYYELVGANGLRPVALPSIDDTTATLDFIQGTEKYAGWSNYYVIVTHYLIKSHEIVSVKEGEFDVKITATAVSKGIELAEMQEFRIPLTAYNVSKNGDDGSADKFKIRFDDVYIFTGNAITISSYYDFAASENNGLTAESVMGGTYYDDTEHVAENTIIAGHHEIDLGWAETTENPIMHQTLYTQLSFNSTLNAQILKGIITKLQVSAVEFNASDRRVGYIGSNIIEIGEKMFGFVQAGSEYNEKTTYYQVQEGKMVAVTVSDQDKTDWTDKEAYKKYFVASDQSIIASVKVMDALVEGHYVKFEWKYVAGGAEYSIIGPKVTISSRDVKNYVIDVEKELHVAQAIAAGANANHYTYDKETGKFTPVAEANIDMKAPEGTYYTILETLYTGEIRYMMEVGYDSDKYTYKMYVVDVDGNLLVANLQQQPAQPEPAPQNTPEDPTEPPAAAVPTHEVVRADANNVALKLKTMTGGVSNGCWIKPYPFYASNPEFVLECGSITFDTKVESFKVVQTIASAKETALAQKPFVDLKIQALDATQVTTISIKVVQDGKFTLDKDGVVWSESTKTFNVPSTLYTYDTTSAMQHLDIAITDFQVMVMGQEVSDEYTIVDGKVIEIDTQSELAWVAYDESTKSWTVNRNKFINIKLTLTLDCMLGTETVDLTFTSPYKLNQSKTNTTSEIYAGTSFVMLTVGDVAGLEDPLYKLTDTAEGATFVVKYKLDDMEEYEEINGDKGKFVLIMGDDFVTRPTNIDFMIVYRYELNGKPQDEDIETFGMLVHPSIVVIGSMNGLVDLDDYNNKTYDITNELEDKANELVYKKYDSSKEYTTYTSEDLREVRLTVAPAAQQPAEPTPEPQPEPTEGPAEPSEPQEPARSDLTYVQLTYKYSTYTDAECINPYRNNVVEVVITETTGSDTYATHALKVLDPISEQGVYYVKVSIYVSKIGDATFDTPLYLGEKKFKIETKSSLVNADGEEVGDINITANTTKEFTIDDLRQMYALKRGSSVAAAELRDVLWLDLDRDGLDVTYTNSTTTSYTKADWNTAEGAENYKLDNGAYVLETTKQDGVTYYTRDTANINIKQGVEYEYAEQVGDWDPQVTYYYKDSYNDYVQADEKQKDVTYYYISEVIHWLDYDGIKYILAGTEYNPNNYKFNLSDNSRTESAFDGIDTARLMTNVYYTVAENQVAIYTKQSAYVFVDATQDPTKMLVLWKDGDVKRIDLFEIDANDNIMVVKKTSTFAQLSKLQMTYSGFGKNLQAGATNVDELQYGIETIHRTYEKVTSTIVWENNTTTYYYVDDGEYKPTTTAVADVEDYYNIGDMVSIKTKAKHNIMINPYMVESQSNVLLADTTYTLYDSSTSTGSGLLNIKAHSSIVDIAFGEGEDYTLVKSGTQRTITFDANGNNYTTQLPVTITYKGGKTFTYYVEFVIANKNVVSINYPYNVDDKSNPAHQIFNASIEEFTNSIDGSAYDLTDLGKWLGVDTSAEKWYESTRVKYDLALKGDKINLATDEMLELNRFEAYEYANNTNSTYAKDTYYVYDANNNQFKLLASESAPSDWATKYTNYYTRAIKSEPVVGSIDLVAVSSTYANSIANVVENIGTGAGEIIINNKLNYTGYLVFKVYEAKTQAYGYYIVKVVDDAQFNNVVGYGQARRTETISKQIADANIEIFEVINGQKSIHTVAGIGAELVDGEGNNVYLFIISDKDDALTNVDKGDMIAVDTKLPITPSIKTIVIAVVIRSATSLVHVCNYELILQPDVTVSIYYDYEVLTKEAFDAWTGDIYVKNESAYTQIEFEPGTKPNWAEGTYYGENHEPINSLEEYLATDKIYTKDAPLWSQDSGETKPEFVDGLYYTADGSPIDKTAYETATELYGEGGATYTEVEYEAGTRPDFEADKYYNQNKELINSIDNYMATTELYTKNNDTYSKAAARPTTFEENKYYKALTRIARVEDANYHIYEAKPLEYVYGGTNTVDFATTKYLVVSGGSAGELASISVDVARGYTDFLTFKEEYAAFADATSFNAYKGDKYVVKYTQLPEKPQEWLADTYYKEETAGSGTYVLIAQADFEAHTEAVYIKEYELASSKEVWEEDKYYKRVEKIYAPNAKENGTPHLIATIDGTTLTLNAPVSENVSFYLQLTYAGGFKAYLKIAIKEFSVSDTSVVNVGTITGTAFNNTIKLFSSNGQSLLGAYARDYILEYAIDDGSYVAKTSVEAGAALVYPFNWVKTNNELIFVPKEAEYKVKIRLTLTEIYPNKICEFDVTVSPNINGDYAADKKGSEDKNPVTPDIIDVSANAIISTAGSKLGLTMDTNSITIQDATRTTPYFTINLERYKYLDVTAMIDGAKVKYLINSNGVAVSNMLLANGATELKFAHVGKDVDLILDIQVIREWTNESDISTCKRYDKNYSLHIKLLKTYDLNVEYRVVDAKYETAKNNTELNLGHKYYVKDKNGNYTLATAQNAADVKDNTTQWYTITTTLLTADSVSEYYKYNADTQTYTKHTEGYSKDGGYYSVTEQPVVALEKIAVGSHFFGTDTNASDSTNINGSRISVTLSKNNVKYSGYANLLGIGLLSEGNPNKLEFELTAPSGENASDLNKVTKVLTFRSDNTVPENILTFGNQTIEGLTYKFIVFSEENDYSNVKYNNNLTLIGDANDNPVSISLSYKELVTDNVNDKFELAYLKYAPMADIGQVIYVESSPSPSNINFKAISKQTLPIGYNGVIVLDKENSTISPNTTYSVTIKIVTMNGLASSIELNISDTVVSYAYGAAGDNYEYVDSGYEHGKLSDNYRDTTTPRVTAIINNYDVLQGYQYTVLSESAYTSANVSTIYTIENNRFVQLSGTKPAWTEDSVGKYYSRTAATNNYQIEYIGAVRGLISNYTLGSELNYDKDNTSLVYYNKDKGVIASRSVAKDTDVTMIFDIKDADGKILSRIYYSLILQNDIKIGLNPKLSPTDGVVLYLGSEAYESDGKYTTIDLMESKNADNGGLNNIFVTLEQHSTGNTIANNSALFDGTNNSVLASTEVDKHLQFAVTPITKELENKIKVSADGKLYIEGNPATGSSFTLNINSKNVIGYGESYTITIQQYDKTTLKTTQIDVGSGNGHKSGDTVKVLNIDPTYINADIYSIRSYRIGYTEDANGVSKTESSKLPITNPQTNTQLTYQMKVFDEGTSISTIKSENSWSGINSADVLTAEGWTGSQWQPKLPKVKCSVDGSAVYQIVAYRICVTYNGQSQYYYASYKVYSDTEVAINDYYRDTSATGGNMTITYGDTSGAWQTDANTEIILMDINNKGLYSAVSRLTSEPLDWETTYTKYYIEDGNGGYTKVTQSSPKFNSGKYYKLEGGDYVLLATQPADWSENYGSYYIKKTDGAYAKVEVDAPAFNKNLHYGFNDVYSAEYKNDGKDQYEFWIVKEDGTRRQITGITKSDGVLKGVLPNTKSLENPGLLFENEAKITIEIVATDSKEAIIEHNWKIKANQTITPKDGYKPLKEFFLLSEIGDQKYYNANIIGICKDSTGYNKFVKNGEYDNSVKVEIKQLVNKYELHKVTYKGTTSNDVFVTTEWYYVLVGYDYAMSVGSTSDYVNVTVDDGFITSGATFNLQGIVQVWGWEANKFEKITQQGFGISWDAVDTQPSSIETVGAGSLKLKDADKLTSNVSTKVIITSNGITRKIEVYFAYPINAKCFDSTTGYVIDNSSLSESHNDYKIVENAQEAIAQYMTGSEITENTIEYEVELKQALLKLIKYNSQNVNLDPYSDEYNYFKVKVTKDATCYSIQYTYDNGVAAYVRTLKVAIPTT